MTQLKNINGINTDGGQFMFISPIFKKVKERRQKFSQGSVAAL